ncbi:DUF6339 family protein [Pseudomonas granadensis]|uniref:DUF6339 family protein n=1 Tax=Pseudomonas granadensis TaxID=1421430 RepID=UPI00087CE857|nr:DUF6339 family protein [Pseudomonas granadensis]SDT42469.1 hypothetical protein SAMN05216579_3726 [Pseudomonas granadensis]
MASEKLKYISELSLQELKSDVLKNIELYRSGNFIEISSCNGWSISSEWVFVDLDRLSSLNGVQGASSDYESSVVVYKSFEGMTPALAMEERVWGRFTHLECLKYARARWPIKGSDQEQVDHILKHFFAKGRTGVRDDNAISRLWWNMHIANIADPEDPESALKLILKVADIRMALVERPNTSARVPIIRALMRVMRSNQWITSTGRAFQKFMIEVNRDAGGVLFEVLPDTVIDSVMLRCAEKAQRNIESD